MGALRDWTVSSRLVAVIVLALAMGLVFGALRVVDAVGGADQFGRVSQLAQLSDQLTILTQDLQNERDQTAVVIAGGSQAALRPLYAASDSEAATVRQLASGIGGGFPANIQSDAADVESDAGSLDSVRTLAKDDPNPSAIITDYATPISDMIALSDQIAQGVSDPGLANDVRTLTALSQAKEQAAEQRALLSSAMTQNFFGVGVQTALNTAVSQEQLEETALSTTATAQENSAVSAILSDPQVGNAESIEGFMLSDSSPFSDLGNMGLSNPAAQWYRLMSYKLDRMQNVERQIAGNIVARAQSLQSGAQRSALITGIVTLLVLLLVLAATLLVARSLVRPLERLRAAALDIAMTQLPDRVRRIGETDDPEQAGDDITPIDVASGDEIGQVARAFDQVHREAVRLASNEAMLRSNFNAMFVNLSRRSQLLIERLARMIDSLEQAEEDPDRLSSLFSMDHLVTRMRRNSENLLLLAGHEGARKWSEPAPLSDVARAAVSEIEQYGRVALNSVPGVFIEGQAVSDIVHLLAELIENATMFSSKETQVHASARELSSGGVLIEIADRGVGISEARLTELNWRLDNPPVIDVSVTRHMGLFAVGRLAQRHGVRVRLRPGNPQGLTALVWLPDAVIERKAAPTGGWWEYPTGPTATVPGAATPGYGIPLHAGSAPARTGPAPAHAGPAPAHAGSARARPPSLEPAASAQVQAPGRGASRWFRNQAGSPGGAGPGGAAPGGGPAAVEPTTAGRTASGLPVRAPGGAAPGGGLFAAPVAVDPPTVGRTASGLPVRAPGASYVPGGEFGGAPGAGSGAPGGGVADQERSPLSPDRARSRLSGFQSGARRAKHSRPDAGEGAGR
ncbi:MAG TPA: nitrate- and nitrite sensing domain-containing protein [Trebonia sp.]